MAINTGSPICVAGTSRNSASNRCFWHAIALSLTRLWLDTQLLTACLPRMAQTCIKNDTSCSNLSKHVFATQPRSGTLQHEGQVRPGSGIQRSSRLQSDFRRVERPRTARLASSRHSIRGECEAYRRRDPLACFGKVRDFRT